MDEATSSLDNDIEDEDNWDNKNLKGKTTLVFISHKLSNLEICDEKFEVIDSNLKKYEKTLFSYRWWRIYSQILWKC